MRKTIDLSSANPEELKNLERLHYESVTKERIVSLAMSNANNINSSLIDKYYEDYLQTFTKCEQAKQELFEKYIKQHVDNPDATWEINFYAKVVVISD